MIGVRHSRPALHSNDARTNAHKEFTKHPRLAGQRRVRRVTWCASLQTFTERPRLPGQLHVRCVTWCTSLQSSVSQAAREDAESAHKGFTGELAHITHETTNRKVSRAERRAKIALLSKSLPN
ncbi:hypothetical protein NDU88_001179 [Pleurodeles waltl]|uniref:Uncharacterized protein n=1 Tax=Pleurodeles waltl TaxID=8319 RepID=A0AAV7NI89_PLEWA|nr:hypothetical protein NDU88_001179 [Pleurodeles waltl]